MTADLFRDKDIAFAQRLMQAGVPCEFHVHPGAYHASETFAPEAALSRLGSPSGSSIRPSAATRESMASMSRCTDRGR